MKRYNKLLINVLCLVTILLIFTIFAFSESIVRFSSVWPVYIDPATSMDSASVTVYVNLYDPLVFPDKFGNPLPHVAEKWEKSSDGLTYTFYLRPGINFHNGSELTAEDVKFSMDRLIEIGEGVAFLFFDKIKNTEVIDKYTVVFHLEKTFGPFVAVLEQLFIINKDLVVKNIKKPGMYGEMGDYGKEYISLNDVGSGPYMIKDYKQKEYMLMQKNPNYWIDIKSAPEEFKMIGSTEPALVKTLMSRKELEATDMWHSEEVLSSLDKIEGVEVARWWPSVLDYYMSINTKKAPTDDIHVRKAMAWAFDYAQAMELVPGSVQAKGPTLMYLKGSDPNAFQYKRDLEKAKAEIKKSKYYGQLENYPVDSVWNDEIKEKVSMLFMANMADIGITVNNIKLTWSKLVDVSASQETTPHVTHIFDTPRYPEAGSMLEARYHSKTSKTWENNEWLLDEKLDEMIEDAVSTSDEKDRMDKYGKISKYIMDLCPTIFVIEMPENRAYQTYMDWPATRGEAILVPGYENAIRFITLQEDK